MTQPLVWKTVEDVRRALRLANRHQARGRAAKLATTKRVVTEKRSAAEFMKGSRTYNQRRTYYGFTPEVWARIEAG